MRGSFIEEMTAFLNSFRAIPAPSMIMGFGGQMRSVAAEALWKLANKMPITIYECSAMFYSDWVPSYAAASHVQNRYYASATPGVEAQAAPTNNSNDSAATRSARPRIVDSDESELDNNDTDTAAMRNASTSAQHTDECDADANVINEDAQPHTTPRISRTRPRSNPVRATPYSRIRRTLDEIPRRVTRGSRASSTSLREYEPIDQVCRCTGANTCCM